MSIRFDTQSSIISMTAIYFAYSSSQVIDMYLLEFE